MAKQFRCPNTKLQLDVICAQLLCSIFRHGHQDVSEARMTKNRGLVLLTLLKTRNFHIVYSFYDASAFNHECI